MSGPHKNSSFSYKTINPKIKKVLNSRSLLDNTIQLASPFIKATTTLNMPDILGLNNVGFTLGLHATLDDARMEDIYSDQNGNALIGYTYTPNGQTQRVYAQTDQNLQQVDSLLNNGAALFENTKYSQIAPPGITSFTIGRNKNGLLAHGELRFSVPTLAQLEMLHRTFLIPGVGMVLEWGQVFAPTAESVGEKSVIEKMFPWNDRNELLNLLDRLGKNEVGMEEILNSYVYPSDGQYMWMFGRVGNFSTKTNSDGSFECSVKIVGPSENAWAYGTRNTIIPPKVDGVINPNSVNSVESFFTTTSPGTNFKSLIEKAAAAKEPELAGWKTHITTFGNPKPTSENNSEPNASQQSFADAENGYFITWRFFVNVVLNNQKYGLKKIFVDAGITTEELAKISLLRPYSNLCSGDINITTPYINDPYENFVGNNRHLRSVDPSTMIIVNEEAVEASITDLTQVVSTDPANREDTRFWRQTKKRLDETELSKDFKKVGDFYLSPAAISSPVTPVANDKGLLSTGVWINHNAIVQAMASSDTILGGITNLLQRMSAATMGFWQLAIDTAEPISAEACRGTTTSTSTTSQPDITATNYTVVDMNYRENSEDAVNGFIEEVHIFNKFIRNAGGQLVASDVMECSVDLNLPKKMFSQIATLGLVQNENSPIIGDPNETLRRMFAITTLSTRDGEQGPDLTLRQNLPRNTSNFSVGVGGQTVLNSAGTGNTVASANVQDVLRNGTLSATATATIISPNITPSRVEQIDRLKRELAKVPCTTICKPQVDAVGTTLNNQAVVSNGAVVYTDISGNLVRAVISRNHKGKTTTTEALFNRGYRNGRMPNEILVPINQGNHKLIKQAARKFIDMSSAALRAPGQGVTLEVSDSYRTLQSQIDIVPVKGLASQKAPFGTPPEEWLSADPTDTAKYQKGLAATPGTSNHGWGLAVDIRGTRTPNSPILRWLQQNAATYGFTPIAGEPWHWEYTGVIPESDIPQFTAPDLPPIVEPKEGDAQTSTNVDSEECNNCAKKQIELNQLLAITERTSNFNQGAEAAVRKFPGLESTFRYVEVYPDLMVAKITRDSNGNSSNAFGAAPGALSINADLVLPGINGLRIGELFWIDRIPTYYRAFGAFQIMSIEDVVGSDGWQTKISAKFNFLGNKWRERMATILSEVAPLSQLVIEPRDFG